MVATLRKRSRRSVVLGDFRTFCILVLSLSAAIGSTEAEKEAAEETSAAEIDQPAVGVALAARDAKLAEAIAGSRTDANVARDKYRHPLEVAERAGFKLVGKSEINANPKDTKDYPEGVWMLPPGFYTVNNDADREK
jgi:hypothetical protein